MSGDWRSARRIQFATRIDTSLAYARVTSWTKKVLLRAPRLVELPPRARILQPAPIGPRPASQSRGLIRGTVRTSFSRRNEDEVDLESVAATKRFVFVVQPIPNSEAEWSRLWGANMRFRFEGDAAATLTTRFFGSPLVKELDESRNRYESTGSTELSVTVKKQISSRCVSLSLTS